MQKTRAYQLAVFVRDELNTQEEIDFVLNALMKKTCKNGSIKTDKGFVCKECPWNFQGLCRRIDDYIECRFDKE